MKAVAAGVATATRGSAVVEAAVKVVAVAPVKDGVEVATRDSPVVGATIRVVELVEEAIVAHKISKEKRRKQQQRARKRQELKRKLEVA